MKKLTFEKRTRQVFHNIHREQARDGRIFSRITSLLNEDYLHVKEGFFRGKVCLDAGCGSAAPGAFSMLKMGAGQVYCIDLDSSIFKIADAKLKPYSGKYIIETGNVLDLKYPNEYFDFVHCAGVLHHTRNTQSIFCGLKELARVTKRGGMLYIMLKGKSGIIGDITDRLRKRYAKDKKFKKLIDHLSPKFFHELISFMLIGMNEMNDCYAKNLDEGIIRDLFDKDLILTIKDRIQAPSYLEISEEKLKDWMAKNNFSEVIRLTRYPRYTNIRRFLSPLYYNSKNKYSALLYGDGIIQLKATKN